MAKIRYSELPVGLHVSAVREGRRTVIYLKPGLTRAERRAALSRVRISSRIGHGPQLRLLGLAVAVGADSLRTTTRNLAGALRGHPALLFPPLVLLASTAIVFILMSFVSVTVPRHQQLASSSPPGVATQPMWPAASAAGRRHGEPGSNTWAAPSRGQSSNTGPSPDPSRLARPSPAPAPIATPSPTPNPAPAPPSGPAG